MSGSLSHPGDRRQSIFLVQQQNKGGGGGGVPLPSVVLLRSEVLVYSLMRGPAGCECFYVLGDGGAASQLYLHPEFADRVRVVQYGRRKESFFFCSSQQTGAEEPRLLWGG